MNERAGADGGGPPAAQTLETPFLGLAGYEAVTRPEQPAIDAPFVAEYRLGDEIIDAGAGAARTFLAELFDSEFDEALDELVNEAQAEVERLGTDETPAAAARAERFLQRWIEPLRAEAEAVLERMAADLEAERVDTLNPIELDELLERYQPDGSSESDLPPAFENFLDKLKKKLKRAVKGAVRLAKKGIAAVSKVLPIGQILRKLTKLVRPLLKRVVNMALDKLPPALRPYAAKLAKRFTGELKDLEDLTESGGVAPAVDDVRSLQLSLDTEIAALLFAPDEVEQEELLAEATAVGAAESDTLAELDDARARFLERFAALESGEDPTPVVEEFLPAVLPALRIGIRIVGRPKVVSFLARYLGRLIAPYVGPQITPALSQAIVDAGLRLMTLEAPVEPTPGIAAEAFANSVEDTVRRVSELSDEELEDEFALEAAAYEGFQEAVAANFPAALLEPASEYLETARPGGTWVSMPRGRRPRYRKYSLMLPVVITPQAARSVRTYGGRTLDAVLRHRGVRRGIVRGRLHLYQAVPGSRTGRIVRAERRVGSVGRDAGRAALHPLTREAAGLLLGEPGLGREVAEGYLDRPDPLVVGERLYFLELLAPGAAGGQLAGPGAGRVSGADLALDLNANELRLVLYLSESDAQAIAVRLRRKEPLGATMAALRRIYRDAVRAAVARPRGLIRAAGEEPESEAFAPGLLRLARSPSQLLVSTIERWVGRALGTALAGQRDAYIAATVAEADGVTLLVRLSRPPGLRLIAQLLRSGPRGAADGPRSLGDLRGALRGQPQAGVEIRPGYQNA